MGAMASIAPGVGDEIGLAQPEFVGKSPRQLFWARFRQDRVALLGVAVIVALALLAIFAGVIADLVGHPVDRLYSDRTDEFGVPIGPDSSFVFGADVAGRDLFVRVLYGARTSLLVAGVSTAIAVLVGVTIGLVAGYFGRWVDTIISRVIDVVLSMPIFLFAIGIAAACGLRGCLGGSIQPGRPLVIFVIALFSWPYVARIVRGQTISIREKEFVEASRSLGASHVRIMAREVLPNLVAPIVIYTTLLIPSNIIFEASLSFLGLGLPDHIPSWGRMLADASQVFDVAWWTMVFPGAFLVATVHAFNLLGDGLRDALDPRTGR